MNKQFEVYYKRPEGNFALVRTLELPAYLPVKSALEEIFNTMQGEVWSRNGEQREFILSKGLTHTSMSVGDFVRVVEIGDLWRVEPLGWKKVTVPCEE